MDKASRTQQERLFKIKGQPLRFLIIDPLVERLEAWERMLDALEQFYHCVSTVESANEILSQSNHFDCVLMEYRESPDFVQMSRELHELRLKGKVRDLIICSFPDIKFEADLKPFVRNKPYLLSDIVFGISESWHSKALVTGGRDESLVERSNDDVVKRIQGMRVLTVEDNSMNHRVINLILTRAGVDADQAWNGKEAVDLAAKYRYDVVLMDVQMPVMDGLQATRIIKAQDHPPYVVGITANAQEADRQKALDSKMDHYLTKPIRKKELLEVLERLYCKDTG